ncbi:hypothetical protein M378DRAFT_156455 [Amanita muscaria Koide BX008]|uniref:Uncharacterized protein n=1 Tax=Amanita muscaria (strain Koide BX008) TaxID=946122 RepID=A0A0C2XLD3_AMAMK|nr:hypothetical protein M378DRAFT_156455 [Amanita muscaria Koide BX008]
MGLGLVKTKEHGRRIRVTVAMGGVPRLPCPCYEKFGTKSKFKGTCGIFFDTRRSALLPAF